MKNVICVITHIKPKRSSTRILNRNIIIVDSLGLFLTKRKGEMVTVIAGIIQNVNMKMPACICVKTLLTVDIRNCAQGRSAFISMRN